MKKDVIKKVIVWAVSILLVCGIVGGFLHIKKQIEQTKKEAQYEAPQAVMTQDEMEALYDMHKNTKQEAVMKEAEKDTEENSADKKEEDKTLAVYQGCPIDFEGMWEVNKDVYAWITIPGTVIDYPILQHETDNTYYLNYNIDGSYGYPGCIYTENMNTKDFTDNNTIIYGHNMKNGTMFAGLHQYKDEAFLEENDTIYIYTPKEQLTYCIFAAYVYDDRHLMYSYDFSDKEVYGNYLAEIKSMRSMDANIRDEIGVTKEDKMITLVTCIGNQPEKRLLVQAVLLKDGE